MKRHYKAGDVFARVAPFTAEVMLLMVSEGSHSWAGVVLLSDDPWINVGARVTRHNLNEEFGRLR